MNEQLAIDLPYRPALGRADFLVSDCNADALQRIESWPAWAARALVLHGPPDSGKSHLTHLWCARSGGRSIAGAALAGHDPSALAAEPAVAIDDAERADERLLLHLFNCCAESGAGLLVVARQPPAVWPISLPDLASRLRSAQAVGIGAPDDTLLAAVLVKHFSDRQLPAKPGVIAYLVQRMERSFAAAAALAATLDRRALSAHRPVGLALARQALAELAAPERISG
ncbi:MAG TPA: DNA replication protein [Stellaceae bacterium]